MYAFLYSHWVSLPLPTRHKIALILNIPKTGPTHVQDNRVVEDGYTLDAVEKALGIDNLISVLGVEGTPEELWTKLIEEATTPVVIPVVVSVAETVEEKKDQTLEESNAKPEKIKVIKAPSKPRGRPKKAK